MKKQVAFGMFWQMYGTCVVDLPDEINEKDAGAVLDYIREHWADFPLPAGSYVLESDELDEGAEIIVTYEDGSTISHDSPDEIE